MKGIAKLGIILAIFSAVACASLAVVYAVTKDQIAMQDQIALTASLKEIFPGAASFEDVTTSIQSADPDVKFSSAMLAKGTDTPLGVAVKASGPSYGGQAVLLVGILPDKSVAGVRILELNDTPGLGANAKNAGYFVKKAEKVTFPGQFTGKLLADAFEVKKDVVAITASTITSKALTKIVKVAADAGAAWLAGSVPAAAPAAAAAETTGGK